MAQIIDVPVPQIVEEMIEGMQDILQERIPERIVEQNDDVPVRPFAGKHCRGDEFGPTRTRAVDRRANGGGANQFHKLRRRLANISWTSLASEEVHRNVHRQGLEAAGITL